MYWQDSKDVLQTHLHMLDNEILCDTAFLVGYSAQDSWKTKYLSYPPLVYQKLVKEGVESHKSKITAPKKILVHRVILASRSSVFERMFATDMRESKKGVDDPIAVVDIDQESFKEMLRYIYGNTAKITNENVFRLWYVARKYMLEGLEKLCVEHLLNNLSRNTACAILDHCLFFDCDLLNLRQHCLRFICLEISHIPESEYTQLSHDALYKIISQNTIGATEDKLYLICQKWAESCLNKLGYMVTVMCKSCRLEYNMLSTELQELLGAFDVDNLECVRKNVVTNGTKRKHDNVSTNEPVASKLQRIENALSPCHSIIMATRDDNSDSTEPASSNDTVESFSTVHVALGLADASNNITDQSSVSQVSIQQEFSPQSLSASVQDNQNDVFIESFSTRTPVNNETQSVAQNSVEHFTCGHVDERNPSSGLIKLSEKTDTSKMAALRQIYGDIIYRIRFSTMTQALFALDLGYSSLLTLEEKNGIYYDMIVRKYGVHYTPRDGSAMFDRGLRAHSTETEFCRFDRKKIDYSDCDNGGRYVGTSSLLFKVTKPILLQALGFYCGIDSDCEPFRVELAIKLNNVVVSTRDLSVKPNPHNTGIQTEDLSSPCYIRDNMWYEIKFTIHESVGPRYFGLNGYDEWVSDSDNENGPDFVFKNKHGSTTVEKGQLATLSYAYL